MSCRRQHATAADAFGLSGLATTCDTDSPIASACNIFKPGAIAGTTPVFKQITKGTAAYATDYNNFAPSIGVNWTPTSSNGVLKTLMGDDGQFARFCAAVGRPEWATDARFATNTLRVQHRAGAARQHPDDAACAGHLADRRRLA